MRRPGFDADVLSELSSPSKEDRRRVPSEDRTNRPLSLRRRAWYRPPREREALRLHAIAPRECGLSTDASEWVNDETTHRRHR